MPLQHRSRPHGTTHEGTNPRAGHRKGEDVGKAEVMCRLYLGSVQTRGRGKLLLVAEELAKPEPLPRVSAGRTEMMRDIEAEKLRAARDKRSERARAYYQEWNERLSALWE
jgi:hypothetical protein